MRSFNSELTELQRERVPPCVPRGLVALMLAIYFAGRRFDSRCTIPLTFLGDLAWSAVWAGIFYLMTGVLGATVASVFTALPTELVAAIAGIALLGTIGNSLHGALREEGERDAALITFLVTAGTDPGRYR